MSKKGPQWERDVATMLSEWWTADEPDGPRQDVFWRTAGSGARATTRGKKGKQTKNAHGDQLASDPIGQPLIDFILFEVKRGYSNDHIHALLDRPARGKMPMYGKWIVKAQASAKSAGVPHWMIISKRDRRDALVIASMDLWDSLSIDIIPLWTFYVDDGRNAVGGCRLSEFLQWVEPDDIREALKRRQRRKT